MGPKNFFAQKRKEDGTALIWVSDFSTGTPIFATKFLWKKSEVFIIDRKIENIFSKEISEKLKCEHHNRFRVDFAHFVHEYSVKITHLDGIDQYSEENGQIFWCN